jgi:hypothetical protein
MKNYTIAGILDRWITAGRFEFALQIFTIRARVYGLVKHIPSSAAFYLDRVRVSYFIRRPHIHWPFLCTRILDFNEILQVSSNF